MALLTESDKTKLKGASSMGLRNSNFTTLAKASLRVAAGLSIALLFAFGFDNSLQVRAQSKKASDDALPSFEVASIKPYKRPPRGSVRVGMFGRRRSGRFSAMGVTVRGLILAAYGVEDAQIVGGPKWINSEQFDIQAEADSATDAELRKLSPDQAILVKRHMVRGLLAERFGLKLHHETRDLPVYALVVAKHGPKLQEVSKPTNPVPAGAGGVPKGFPAWYEHDPRRAASFASYTTMSQTARNLSRSLGRPVLDKTGLNGHYSYALYWSMTPGERFARVGRNFGSGVQASGVAPPPGPSGPSIFTALQEQLGLKLKSEKGPVDVLVIDYVEPPTPN